MIRFTVNAVPVAQPRQRHRVVEANGRTFTSNYTPAKHPVQAFKASVRLALSRVYAGAPLDGPLELRVVFLMPRPGRLRWKTRPMPRLPHESKPDSDNLLKALKDSLSGLAWHDDAQVSDVVSRKRYAAGDEPPHCEVEIRQVQEVVTVGTASQEAGQ